MKRSTAWALALSASAVLAAACGSSKNAGYDDGAGSSGGASSSSGSIDGPLAEAGASLAIDPVETSLSIEDGKPLPTADFKTTLVHADGSKEDVTAEAKFSVPVGFGGIEGTFEGGRFTPTKNAVGKGAIHAEARGLSADAKITIRAKRVIVADGAPADAATKFGGGDDPSKKPSIAYPQDGVMVPPNMNEIDLHFVPGAGQTLFELSVVGDLLDLRVYMACAASGGGCVNRIDKTIWKTIAEGGRGQLPYKVKLRGVNGATPGLVGASAEQAMSFGEENITGGIYYWNASPGATMRYEFGVSGQKAETYMNAASAGASTCVGCHVLSRDGKKVAIGMDIPAPSPYKVFEVGTKAQVYQQGGQFGGGANFFSFSPDTSKILTSNGVTIEMHDAATGAIIGGQIAQGAMPDWSPDGSKMVYSKPAKSPPCIGFCGATGVNQASLELMTFDGSTWKAAGTLVGGSSSSNAYYPSFSPDGAFVVFNRAAEPSKNGSYDAPDATLHYVNAVGGGAAPLAKAGSNAGDSWPKWTPVAQAWRGKKLMWFTFSSRRAYGLKMAAGTRAQIWMAAFDPEAAAAGKDASFTAFWLPFQDEGSANHIAQWVTTVVRKPCDDGGACANGEQCVGGVCKPILK